MILLFVAITVALAMIFENRLIYLPSSDGPWDADLGIGHEEVRFQARDGTRLHGWFLPAEKSRGVLLWFHGNAGNVAYRLDLLRAMRGRLPVSVFIIDYRGYGRSEGSPSEEGIYLDARAAYDHLASVRHVPPERIVLFGKSLGGAPAIRLATQVPCAGLILQSTFTSAPAMARRMIPFLPYLSWTVRTRFPNLDSIPSVTVPKLFIHSRDDEMIPFEMGQELFDAAPEPKESYWFSGAGHNDFFEVEGERYLRRMEEFLSRILPP
jgi:fermentation-respiration switch protein FrsA (DUF1100 family)